ncbi:hypothetical protein [Sphingobium sp. HDIP04]|uniref:hypothetical protein n=1 Tax=Sphingobium sp. HDIP04 TaxID=428994 RepID=UPI00038788F1|nr:hypothetical protein [Sphingobium sp. HDIP04]EQA97257.1 hypothetical protein L286_23310 [Sphingobium sp. HDIP04]
MTAYNPIATMQRLQEAGLNRRQAETLADEFVSVRDDLVTLSDLKAELNAVALRICAAMALGFTALGFIVSLK